MLVANIVVDVNWVVLGAAVVVVVVVVVIGAVVVRLIGFFVVVGETATGVGDVNVVSIKYQNKLETIIMKICGK